MKNRNLLALDLGIKTGWATLDNSLLGPRIESGVQTFELGRGESPGMRFIRFNVFLREMLENIQPQIVFYDQPITAAGHGGGYAAELLTGMATRVQEQCAERRIEHAGVWGSTLKKWATGKGNAKKPAMVARAQELFPGIKILNDDHADALLLLRYGEEKFCPKEDR